MSYRADEVHLGCRLSTNGPRAAPDPTTAFHRGGGADSFFYCFWFWISWEEEERGKGTHAAVYVVAPFCIVSLGVVWLAVVQLDRR